MTRGIGAWAALAAALLSSGCSSHLRRVDLQSAPLDSHVTSIVALKCPYRLVAITDARKSGEDAGGVGWNKLVLADAPAVVRRELLALGFVDASGAAPMPGRDVSLAIRHLYVIQSASSKVPVAVYEVRVGDGAPYLVRSQEPSVNWNGTGDETTRAFSRALLGANQKLVLGLNSACPVAPAPPKKAKH